MIVKLLTVSLNVRCNPELSASRVLALLGSPAAARSNVSVRSPRASTSWVGEATCAVCDFFFGSNPSTLTDEQWTLIELKVVDKPQMASRQRRSAA